MIHQLREEGLSISAIARRVGQHTAVSPKYARECRPATKEERRPLHLELVEIYENDKHDDPIRLDVLNDRYPASEIEYFLETDYWPDEAAAPAEAEQPAP